MHGKLVLVPLRPGSGKTSACEHQTMLRNRVSYAAGKWERFQRTKRLLPYLVYSAINDGRTRPLHARWGGVAPGSIRVVLPVDHPWWDTHFPPNGWGCRCTVRAVTRAEVVRMGLDPDKLEPPPVTTTLWRNPRTGQRVRVPNGIDPGFAYNPGRAPLDPLVPRHKTPSPPDGLLSKPWRPPGDAPYPPNGPFPPIGRPPPPAPRLVDPALLLPAGLSAEEYAAAFLQPFGATLGRDAIHIDKVGMPLAVGRSLFVQANGAIKVDKFRRGPFMRILASALMQPQEIWIEVDHLRRLVRRYILRFTTGEMGADDEAGLVVFSVGADGWDGVTAFPVKSGASAEARRAYIDRELRRGFLVWRG